MRQLNRNTWTHKISLGQPFTSDKDLNAIDDWLYNQIGEYRDRWNIVYGYKKIDFYFKNDWDAIKFALKWS